MYMDNSAVKAKGGGGRGRWRWAKGKDMGTPGIVSTLTIFNFKKRKIYLPHILLPETSIRLFRQRGYIIEGIQTLENIRLDVFNREGLYTLN